ncbi:hypothetical protein [Mycolicibacterium llatzerense]|uniref:hypothetical protein n=1 Tax=Mycolicibacterium llatzerense TaxID=280871 RepID=UPI0031D2CC2B
MAAEDFERNSLVASRICEHGAGITYVATLESRGPEALAAVLDQIERSGLCVSYGDYLGKFGDSKPRPEIYALVDVVNADDGVYGDMRAVLMQSQFDQLRGALSLRITSSKCGHGCA